MFNNLLKLSSIFYFNTEVLEINRLLSRAKGFDAFERILNKFGYSIGDSFARNKYYAIKKGEKVEDMYFKGDYEKFQLIPKKPKKKPTPKDVYFSPAAIYEKFHDDVNDVPLTDFFTQYNVSNDIQQFLSSIAPEKLKYYLPEIKRNPNITLQQVQSIVPKEEVKIQKEPQNTKQEIEVYTDRLEDPYKTWALIEFRKLRRLNRTDDYADFKLKLRNELRDWFHAVNPQIASYNWITAIYASDKWHKEISEAAGGIYQEGNQFIIYGPEWKNEKYNGWTIKRIYGKNDLEAEGNKMDHCVGSYVNDVDEGKIAVYSLRDAQNEPHVTLGEAPPDSHDFFQSQGKGNIDPLPEYKLMIGEWLSQFKGVFLPDYSDYIHEMNFSNISHGYQADIDEEIYSILFGDKVKNDYGLEIELKKDDLYYLFSSIVDASKERRDTSSTPSYLLDSVKYVVQKAKEINSPDLKRIEEYAQHIEEKSYEMFYEWSDNNYSAYAQNFDIEDYEDEEAHRDAIESAMQQDFDNEIKNALPYSLTRLALDMIYEKDK